jgi:23S rRNA (adenine2030-N6)-methyltransferase
MRLNITGAIKFRNTHMLSYQHCYHAGNPADVHKHIALLLALNLLQQKESGLCYVDTHAGRGIYDLQSDEAQKTHEAEQGILQLSRHSCPAGIVKTYLDLINNVNPEPGLRYYPGSAKLAQAVLRAQDKAILIELHPQEYPVLKKTIGRDKRLSIHMRDCYEGLPALVPPDIKRGLVLIDPSYEVKTEYQTITELLHNSHQRWPNAVYMLWYPVLAENRHTHLIKQISTCLYKKTLNCEYLFSQNTEGMLGSGIVMINPPWQFDDQFHTAMQDVMATADKSTQRCHHLRWLHKE